MTTPEVITHISIKSISSMNYLLTINVSKVNSSLKKKGNDGDIFFKFQGGNDDFKKMCREITCWNDTEKICHRSPKSAPGDGTPCESGKSCREETCLPDPKVPSGQSYFH